MLLTIFIAILTFIFSVLSMASFSAHSAVYFIILTFLSSGLLYYILGSTYVSIMLFIVYVGAVAILFIFCVMLLNLKTDINPKNFYYYVYTPFLFLSLFIGFYIYFIFFQFNTTLVYVDWSSFFYSIYSKDTIFLSTFYTLNSFYITLIGLLLFFVTVAVTALLG